MRRDKIVSLILIIFMFFAVIVAVSFGTHIYMRRIVEVYCKKIILSEEIVFDDNSTLNHYEKTIILHAGATGEKRDEAE